MKRQARVIDQSADVVTLKLLKNSNCESCVSHCNDSLINLFGLKNNVFKLSVKDDAVAIVNSEKIFTNRCLIGQTIEMSVTQSDVLKSSLILYIIPLLFCLFGLTLGHYFSVYLNLNTDIGALVGLILCLLIVTIYYPSEHFKKHLKFSPKVTIL